MNIEHMLVKNITSMEEIYVNVRGTIRNEKLLVQLKKEYKTYTILAAKDLLEPLVLGTYIPETSELYWTSKKYTPSGQFSISSITLHEIS
jgi:hypothetical protein